MQSEQDGAAEEPKTPSTVDDKPHLGYAVLRESRFPRYLSVSAVRKFDPNSEGGCERRAVNEALGIWQKEKIQSTAQKSGGDSGRLIEHYLRTGAPVLPPHLLVGKRLLPAPGLDSSSSSTSSWRNPSEVVRGRCGTSSGRSSFVRGCSAWRPARPLPLERRSSGK